MNIPQQLHAWAAPKAGEKLVPQSFPLAQPGPNEALLEVLACGICHSDLHLIDNDWAVSRYPLVPGHEILGKVVARGEAVTHLEIGSVVGVGWQRSACLQCEDCLTARDNMCVHKRATCVGFLGGYADFHLTDSRYCFPMPKGTDKPEFAPLLCGGATVFNPLLETLVDGRARTGRIGVVGLGGLGHLAVKFAKAMGLEVTMFSSSPKKEAEARAMGAHHFVASNQKHAIADIKRSLDLVLVTANVDLPWGEYLDTLRTDGSLCFVGLPPSPISFSVGAILDKRARVMGSPIASRAQIHQMLEFSARHGISADSEIFPFEQVNEAIEAVRGNRVHYRAVLTRGQRS